MYLIKSWDEYLKHYEESKNNHESFWEKVANHFTWHKKWEKIHSGNLLDINYKWYEGAKLNITENCLDRHVEKNPDKVAVYFEPNQPTPTKSSLTYKELLVEVCRFSNVLKGLGLIKGDRVCLYMGLTHDLLIATLACARIGVVHSVVFGGFSAHALSERINDAEAKLVITMDSIFRGEKEIHLKNIVDEALLTSPIVEKVLIIRRTQNSIKFFPNRDLFYHDLVHDVSNFCPAASMNAEDPLFILYTSGSTGKPKGVLHTIAGYMVGTAYSFANVFQLNDERDIFWCTADIGWITGHSYVVYGPLLNGKTILLFEGTPTYPHAGRFWEVIQKYQVTHFYTAPTAIRSLMSYSKLFVESFDLSSLKVLGSVGEPINEEAWHWYNEVVGKKRCPIVDTWWQTETGSIMISALAGITKTKPSYASLPLPGIFPALVDANGKILEGNQQSGNLIITRSFPSMSRTLWKDHERFKQTYFSTYPGYYFTGDGCLIDEQGYHKITGRVDDVINVSGHRIGTAEVENAINLTEDVIESAVVGFPHEIKGQALYAFVIAHNFGDEIKSKIQKKVVEQIGALARIDKIQFVSQLPKTRSGKIMRRILRKVACNELDQLGDTSTLLDQKVVDELILNRL